MATRRKKILSGKLEKSVYDLRGSQTRIFRLTGIDKLSFLHMLFYRVLIFTSFIVAVLVAASLFISNSALMLLLKLLILFIWVIFTPQLFSTFKVIPLILSNGFVFGHLNKSFLSSRIKESASYRIYRIFPYAGIALWLLGLIAMILVWFK